MYMYIYPSMTHLLFVDEEAGTKPPKKQIDGKPTPMTAGLLLDYERSAQAARGVPRHAEQKQHGRRNGVTKWAWLRDRVAWAAWWFDQQQPQDE
jgi:hypothetical protein